MSYLQETKAAGREIFPDLARAAALIGIAMVNVGMFSYSPNMGGYADGGLTTGLDQAAFFGVNALFLMKSYTLFSFMFGVGFAYQIASAERASVGFSGRYWRRIIGLFFFAAINIVFFFQGDILFIYGVLGSVLFLFRKAGTKTLIGWAIGFYAVQVVFILLGAVGLSLGEAFSPEEMLKAQAEMEAGGAYYYDAYANGGFTETIVARVKEWTESIFFILAFQGWGAMSFFLFGLAAVRSDLLTRPDANFWRTCRRIYLPIGLVLSSIGAYFIVQADAMVSAKMMWGMFFIAFGSPFSTAGYLGLLAKWALGRDGPIKTFLARGGTASLTAYLLQGLLFTLIFYEFGLGLYSELGAAACIGIALLVALTSVAFTSLWRAKFKRGPTEYILRTWTYLGAR